VKKCTERNGLHSFCVHLYSLPGRLKSSVVKNADPRRPNSPLHSFPVGTEEREASERFIFQVMAPNLQRNVSGIQEQPMVHIPHARTLYFAQRIKCCMNAGKEVSSLQRF
jgi:hypothetical protein